MEIHKHLIQLCLGVYLPTLLCKTYSAHMQCSDLILECLQLTFFALNGETIFGLR